MPAIVQKILKVTAKIIVGAVAFYLILSFIIIPFGLIWAIRTQGVKLTNHNVHVRSVWFNPVLLRLSVNGFEVLDADNKNVMVGFEKFAVDASFTALFKKIYRIESVSLDGLKVNAALLSDGTINLLGLVPKSNPSNTALPAAPAVKKEESKPQSIPLVVVDRVSLKNGNIQFVDLTVSPNFSTKLTNMNIDVTGLSTVPESQVKVVFNALLDGKGAMASEVLVRPLMQPLQLETIFSLDNYVMGVLSPYVGKYTGRELAQGKLDFKMNYRISDNQLVASHKLLIQHFEFGKKTQSKDALGLPFGLAVALLEDPQGRINIALPVKGDLSDPKFEYWHLVGQVARNFFLKIVTKPFSVLASVVGGGDSGTEEMGYVRFMPGKAELSDEDRDKLNLIVRGLKERPKLSLEIDGSYDPQVDWKAIKTEVFKKNYEDLKKESTRMESWVYRELYERRFGIRALWSLVNKYHRKGDKIDNDPELNTEIKRQLIEDAPPDKLALDVLAQTRAKMIYDLIMSSGFDEKHLSIGANKATQSSMGLVPLEFTLTVFGEPAEPKQDVATAAGQ